jgi:DNA polymerase-3 subunit gamma/tau
MLARIERLERAESISIPVSRATVSASETSKASLAPPRASDAAPKEPAKEPAKKSTATTATKAAPASQSFDIAGLRRLWPDVIEDVKKKRRLTWSLLSASAQIISLDESAITIGIVNAGARDSFLRSNSDEILRQAFIDVVGIDRRIEAIIDPSVEGVPQQKSAPSKGESLDDPDSPSGASLLAKELGAEVIKVEDN